MVGRSGGHVEKYDGIQITTCFVLAFFFLDAPSVQADDISTCQNDHQVCAQVLKVRLPGSSAPDKCYEEAKVYLKSEYGKKRANSEGSFKEYMRITEGIEKFKQCREFLQNLFDQTQTCELQGAKLIFEDKEKESLDQSYFSYQTCQDLEKKKASTKTPGGAIKNDISSGAVK